MLIRDMTESDLALYFCCLEDYNSIIEQALSYKQQWYKQMKDKGLRVKLAIDDDEKIAGMIQYLPVEHSFITGKDMYFIHCIWVHGHKEGIGNRQKRGMGKALLSAAETDAYSLGAKGIIAWGLRIPVWMKASWFRKQGFKSADTQGMMALLYKTFYPDTQKPSFPKPMKKPVSNTNKLILTDFINGWCPFSNVTHYNAQKIAADFPDKIELITYDTTNKAILAEWGIAEGLYINGKEIRSAPPIAYEALKRKIIHKLKRMEY